MGDQIFNPFFNSFSFPTTFSTNYFLRKEPSPQRFKIKLMGKEYIRVDFIE